MFIVLLSIKYEKLLNKKAYCTSPTVYSYTNLPLSRKRFLKPCITVSAHS